MVSQIGPRAVRSNFCKGPAYPGNSQKWHKGPNETFEASKCYLGQNFLNSAPKRSTWQPWPQHMFATFEVPQYFILCFKGVEFIFALRVKWYSI